MFKVGDLVFPIDGYRRYSGPSVIKAIQEHPSGQIIKVMGSSHWAKYFRLAEPRIEDLILSGDL